MAKKSSSSWWLFVLAGIVLVGVIIVAVVSNSAPGQYDAFAQCLTDQGTKVYSASWCPNCQTQKDLFGNSWRIMDDKECSAPGQSNNLSLCQRDNINAVPTWEFGDGSRTTGVQPFDVLVARTGCQLDGTYVSPEERAEALRDSIQLDGINIETTSGSTEGLTITPAPAE